MMRIDPIEQKLLLEGIYYKYGYDFRRYAEASLNRRLQSIFGKFGYHDALDFLKTLLRDPDLFRQVLPDLTISTTELFRDPEVFRCIREKIVPILKTYPSLNFWIAGCSTGEEVYSLAILLREEGLSNRSTIYATDINPVSLKKAQEGVYSLESLQTFARNYTNAGGLYSPSEYYIADYGAARMEPSLRDNVVFTEHNLATDQVFREMHMIFCRNVLIYFNRTLQDRVFQLFTDSLIHHGYLILGTKETLKFSSCESRFRTFDLEARIYQKVERR